MIKKKLHLLNNKDMSVCNLKKDKSECDDLCSNFMNPFIKKKQIHCIQMALPSTYRINLLYHNLAFRLAIQTLSSSECLLA